MLMMAISLNDVRKLVLFKELEINEYESACTKGPCVT
jgi:hypothetical protein